MAQLIVRNVDERLARRLKKLAVSHGVSMEEEHRRILKNALDGKDSFKVALSQIPLVGDDADFERVDGNHREIEL